MKKALGKIANFLAGFMLTAYMAILLSGILSYIIRALLNMGC